jgi:hypothetical protein
MSKKKGLWANIHAKRERIKRGSGERMRKPGSKDAPTADDFKASQTTSEENVVDADQYTQKESVEEAVNPALHRARLIKRVLKPVHDSTKHFKTKETVEPQSTHSDDPDSRFDATDSAVRIYKRDTPGQ